MNQPWFTAYPEREVDRGCPPREVEVVALEVLPLGGGRTGEEWWDRVSGLTITALGEAGEGSRFGSGAGPTQLHNTNTLHSRIWCK